MTEHLRPDLDYLPQTVPARMVNEYVYCPRLFHMEWVQRRFATSDDVEIGLYEHRKVDEPKGNLPEPVELSPDDEGKLIHSLWLNSPALGLAAKADVVEVNGDGAVTPIEYKKGSPREDGEAWPSDRIQVAVQALLLQDAGYRVNQGIVWYRETRSRVRVVLDEETLSQAKKAIKGLWQVATQDVAPPPLANSPKCPRCSLVGICLPDEVNTLSSAATRGKQPHTVMAPDPRTRPVYVEEQGAVVGVRNGRLTVSAEGKQLASFRLIDVSQVNVRGNVTMTPYAMRDLAAAEKPVCWFSYGGWFSAMSTGLPGKHVELRHRQFGLQGDGALEVARRIVQGKIRNCRTLLRRNTTGELDDVLDRLRNLAADAGASAGFPALLGFEGMAAQLYFSSFTSMIKDVAKLDVSDFEVNGRSRRPPPDPLNAVLSFLYSLLTKELTVTLNAIGFDPFFGVYHKPRYGRPALALDMMEEFRPLVADSVALSLINNNELKDSDFTVRVGGCQLDDDARKKVLGAFERRMNQEIRHPTFGYQVTYRRAIDVQCRILAAYLTGEIEHYAPMTTR